MNYFQCAYWIPTGLALSASSLAGTAHAATIDEYPDYAPEQPVIESLANSSASTVDLTTPLSSNVSVELPASPQFTPLPEVVIEIPGWANKAVGATRVTLPEAFPDPRILSPREHLSDETSDAALESLNASPDASAPKEASAVQEKDDIRLAQVTTPTDVQVTPPPNDFQRIPEESEPEVEPLPTLPLPEELFGPEFRPPADEPDVPFDEETFTITRFEVVGSTVFSEAELAVVTAPFTNRPLTFAEVLEVRSAITQLYVDNGYITSGAVVPPQTFQDGGVAMIRVIEGSLEDIQITGTRRLNPGYVGSRIGLGVDTPLNVNHLLERLQLLQLDPLIENISTDLQAGVQPGTNRLVVAVAEADSFDVDYALDNNRSPSVGSIRNQFRITEANLLGLGDRLSVGYSITEGSDGFDIDYTLPLSPHDTTLRFTANFNNSEVIEEPFDVLEIDSDSDSYELKLRQPMVQTPTQEFALGLTASHQESQTFLGIDDIGPFPLSPGADDEGITSVSALRFFQEWTQRSNEQVIALRSQFSFGLDFLDATVNDGGPDSRFFAWQGQGQWVRSLGAGRTLLVRGGVQLSTDSLLTLEQFGLGGQSTVRGYRQDQLLTDNGVLASVEARFPVLRDRNNRPRLQLAPFIDFGHGWNTDGETPDDNTLIGFGTGLLFNFRNRVTARLDYSVPLISAESGDSLQENGFYFSLGVSLF